jgi:hypothetical protein
VTALDLTAEQRTRLEQMVAASVAVNLYRQLEFVDPAVLRAGCNIIGNCSNGSCNIIGNCSSSSKLIAFGRE